MRSDLRLFRGENFASIPAINNLADLISDARKTKNLVTREVVVGPPENQTYIATKALPFGNDVGSDQDGSAGVVIVLHDITNLRRLERVRRDFVANVSHELKTPLTAIRGYVETLLSGALEDPAINVKFLEKIDRNVGRLTNLVPDILSLARIERHEEAGLGAAQAQRWTTMRVDWRSIAQTVIAAYEDEAAGKSLELNLKLSDEPMVVAGEREAMIQILGNLVSNSIKYTPKSGQIWVDCRVVTGTSKNGELQTEIAEIAEISVRDTGIGIPEKHLDRIFERFYRVDVARSRAMGGTGLGLSIVKHLVAGLGGQVTVESKSGGGSTFTVRMKLV